VRVGVCRCRGIVYSAWGVAHFRVVWVSAYHFETWFARGAASERPLLRYGVEPT